MQHDLPGETDLSAQTPELETEVLNDGPGHYAKVAQASRTLTSLMLCRKRVLLNPAYSCYHPVKENGAKDCQCR